MPPEYSSEGTLAPVVAADRDKALVQAARRGDEAAIREIYRAYREPVLERHRIPGRRSPAGPGHSPGRLLQGLPRPAQASAFSRRSCSPGSTGSRATSAANHLKRRRAPAVPLEDIVGSRYEADRAPRSDPTPAAAGRREERRPRAALQDARGRRSQVSGGSVLRRDEPRPRLPAGHGGFAAQPGPGGARGPDCGRRRAAMSLRCPIERRRFVSYPRGRARSAAGRAARDPLGRLRGMRGPDGERVRAGHEAARRFGRLSPDLPARLPELDRAGAGRSSRPGLSPALAVPAPSWPSRRLAVILVLAGRDDRPSGGPAPGTARVRADWPSASSPTELPEPRSSPRASFTRSITTTRSGPCTSSSRRRRPDPEPFVICEVRDLQPPDHSGEGSRVRVYGRARFDAQPGRGWHEVNPVMEIAVLNR